LNADVRNKVFSKVLKGGKEGWTKKSLVEEFIEGNPLDEENRRLLARLTEALVVLVHEGTVRFVGGRYTGLAL